MKFIKLTQDYWATVDDDDYEWIRQHKWHVNVRQNTAYAERYNGTGSPSRIGMHRQIMGARKGQVVDNCF